MRPPGRGVVQGGVEDVDGGHVREVRDDEIGELPGGLLKIESGADEHRGIGDQRQPLTGVVRLGGRPVPVGDVDHRYGHPQDGAARSLQPVVRRRPGVIVVGVGGGPAHDRLIDLRDTGGQHLVHHRLDRLGVEEGQRLADPSADVRLGGDAVDALQRRIDGHIAQVGVQHGQTDGRLRDQTGGEGHIPLHLAQGGLVGGEPEGVDVAAVVGEPHIAELQQPGAAVLVPDGEDPGPGLPAVHHPGEQLEHAVEVLLGHQQPGRVLAECLPGV